MRRRVVAAAALLCVAAVLGTRAGRERSRRASPPRAAFGAPGAQHDPSFVALPTLEDARAMQHTAVILQGGDGGQIYLTAPLAIVRCGDAMLRELLAALDALEWRAPAAASLSYELAPVGSGVFGGLGGGSVVDGVWLHPRLDAPATRAAVEAVVAGARSVASVRAGLERAAGA